MGVNREWIASANIRNERSGTGAGLARQAERRWLVRRVVVGTGGESHRYRCDNDESRADNGYTCHITIPIARAFATRESKQ